MLLLLYLVDYFHESSKFGQFLPKSITKQLEIGMYLKVGRYQNTAIKQGRTLGLNFSSAKRGGRSRNFCPKPAPVFLGEAEPMKNYQCHGTDSTS